MEDFAAKAKRADIKNQIYLMLLLNKNGKFLTQDLFKQYTDFYTSNKDNETLKNYFHSAIEESKKTPAQKYIASELLKALETSLERKESSLSTFMKAKKSERLSLVFIHQLCNEILKTEDNDEELQRFISQLKTRRQTQDYADSKFEQVIQYFMTHNINNPDQLAPFLKKIELLELTLVEAMHLSKNLQNINLQEMQEAIKFFASSLMYYGIRNYDRRLCDHIAQYELIDKYPPENLEEYNRFIKREADFKEIILHGGNHPDLSDSIYDLAEIYGNATTILFSLSEKKRANLSFAFFRTALELQVDLELIIDKFIENNCEIELFNVLEILPSTSLKYLLEKSKKLIFSQEFVEYAQSKIDEQEFYRARKENYKNYPSFEHQVMLACLYKLHPEYFEEKDAEVIKQIYGENGLDVCKFRKQYENILVKFCKDDLQANDITEEVKLGMRLESGVPLLLMLCNNPNFNSRVLEAVKTAPTQMLYLQDTEEGKNMLQKVINSGNIKLLQSLLQEKDLKEYLKDLAIQLDKNGNSIYSVLFTARNNQEKIHEILKTLSEHGISLNITDKYGDTPLTFACKSYINSQFYLKNSDRTNTTKIFEVLFVHVADPNIKIGTETMLGIFLSRNDFKLVELALQNYDNIEISASNITKLIECLYKIEISKGNYEDDGQKKEFNNKKEQLKRGILNIIDLAISKDKAEITQDHADSLLKLMSQYKGIKEIIRPIYKEVITKIREANKPDITTLYMRITEKIRTLPAMQDRGPDNSATPLEAGAPPPYCDGDPHSPPYPTGGFSHPYYDCDDLPDSPPIDKDEGNDPRGSSSDKLAASATYQNSSSHKENSRVTAVHRRADAAKPLDVAAEVLGRAAQDLSSARGAPSNPEQYDSFAAMVGGNSRNAQADKQRVGETPGEERAR